MDWMGAGAPVRSSELCCSRCWEKKYSVMSEKFGGSSPEELTEIFQLMCGGADLTHQSSPEHLIAKTPTSFPLLNFLCIHNCELFGLREPLNFIK